MSPLHARALTGLKDATIGRKQSSAEILPTLVLSPVQLFSMWRSRPILLAQGVRPGGSVFHRASRWPVTLVLFFQVYGLLNTMVTNFMVLADELNPQRDVEEHLRPCT